MIDQSADIFFGWRTHLEYRYRCRNFKQSSLERLEGQPADTSLRAFLGHPKRTPSPSSFRVKQIRNFSGHRPTERSSFPRGSASGVVYGVRFCRRLREGLSLSTRPRAWMSVPLSAIIQAWWERSPPRQYNLASRSTSFSQMKSAFQ
jgi:hypothetical protein